MRRSALRLAPALLAASLLSGCAVQRARAGRFFHFAGYRLTGSSPLAECWREDLYKACLYQSTEESDPKTLVYFFHYAEGDERSWSAIGLGRAFYQRFLRLKRPAPRVVSVSYGSHWLLTREPGKRQTVLLPDFERDVIAQVERRVGVPGRRYAWGMSQGGYNAAEAALQSPALWSGAVLSCPAVHAENPLDPANKAEALARRTHGAPATVEDGLALFYRRLKDSKTWEEDNPIALAGRTQEAPPMLIQANEQDEFGFFEGAQMLAEALRKAGKTITFRPHPGGHCLVDAAQAADFIIGLSTGAAAGVRTAR